MWGAPRWPTAGGLVLVLSGCTIQGLEESGSQAFERLREIDWATTEAIEVRIDHNRFTPTLITFIRGRPYRLRITNADDQPHIFNAPKFFQSAAIASVKLNGEDRAEPCLEHMSVPAAETAEIRLEPLRVGRYAFGGSDIPVVSWSSGIRVMYVEGIIHVEEGG